jgi:hypothetical protein
VKALQHGARAVALVLYGEIEQGARVLLLHPRLPSA